VSEYARTVFQVSPPAQPTVTTSKPTQMTLVGRSGNCMTITQCNSTNVTACCGTVRLSLCNGQTAVVSETELLRAIRTNRTIRAAHVHWRSKLNTRKTSSTLRKGPQSNCFGTAFLDKLTFPHLVEESLIFYGGRKFITAFKTAHNLLYLT
jgi:hypothetical protein